MSKTNEFSEKLARLRSAIDRVADELHLERTQFSFVPAGDGENNDVVNLVFKIKIDALLTDEQREQKTVDAEFEALAAGFTDKTEDKVEKAKKEIEDHLNDWFKD